MKPQGESSNSKPSTLRVHRGVSIKIIETQMVHTDTTHFKSVVQCLTGKASISSLSMNRDVNMCSGTSRVGRVDGGQRSGKAEFDDILKMKLPALDELKAMWDDQL